MGRLKARKEARSSCKEIIKELGLAREGTNGANCRPEPKRKPGSDSPNTCCKVWGRSILPLDRVSPQPTGEEKMITKKQLVEMFCERLEIPKTEAENIIWAIGDVAEEVVSNADKVKFPGLGTLTCAISEARTGRNPATGESIKIPAKVAVRFSVEKALKEKAPSIKKGRAILDAQAAEKALKARGVARASTTAPAGPKRTRGAVKRRRSRV